MARRTKLNTNLDDSLKRLVSVTSDIPDVPLDTKEDAIGIQNDQEGEDITYTMGDIQIAGDDEGERDFQKSSTKSSTSDDAEEEDWNDEEINFKDEDPFLDMEDYDLDNPEEVE